MPTSIFTEYFKGYEILGELGRGNARVLKAKSLQNGQLVAIKHFSFNTDTDTLRRFQRESEIMQSIRHNNIVKIIEVHLDAELPYIVMQLIEGGDLRSLLKTHGLPDIATVITLARQITEALQVIHGISVIHRDIKPENIMYRRLPSGEIHFLLTDFGIARLREQADAVTVTGSSMLTYDYASPEQFSQPKMVNAATDYYSLGIVLYECLTGAVPFEYEQDDLLGHINRVISAPLPAPHMAGGRPVPRSMLLLLEALLRKQPSKRLCNPADVHQLLLTAAGEVTGPVPASTPLQTITYYKQPVSLPKGKRGLAITILALLLLALAIVFSRSNLRHKNNPAPGLAEAGLSAMPVTATKYVLTTGATNAIHARHTATIAPQQASGETSHPRVSLVNGIYYNDFDGPDSLWSTGKDENSEFILLDGKYTMKGFYDSLSYSSYINLDLDTSKDFTITATATHQGEGSADPFGIIFCGDESQDAFFVFYISSNGYYSIGTSVRDEWNELAGWTLSPNIRQHAEMNNFSIEKRNGMLRFLINGKVEKALPFSTGFGTYFGLRTDGTQTVSFDEFIVKGSAETKNP